MSIKSPVALTLALAPILAGALLISPSAAAAKKPVAPTPPPVTAPAPAPVLTPAPAITTDPASRVLTAKVGNVTLVRECDQPYGVGGMTPSNPAIGPVTLAFAKTSDTVRHDVVRVGAGPVSGRTFFSVSNPWKDVDSRSYAWYGTTVTYKVTAVKTNPVNNTTTTIVAPACLALSES